MRKFWKILIALIATRTFMLVLLIILDLPPTPSHDGWYFHHGGDEDSYFALAKSLVQFNPVRSVKTLGFPLMLTPFIYLFGANGPNDILVPVVILHAFIMFNLSIILVALIAEKLTKNKLISLSSAALWTLFPYFLLMINRYEFVHLMCVQELSEPPSMFFSVLAIYLFSLSREKGGKLYPILTGAVIGLASLIRLPNILFAASFILMLLYEKKFKTSVYIFITALLLFTPQLIYNFYFFGSPFCFGYSYYFAHGLEETYGYPVFSLAYFPPLFITTIAQAPLIFLSASLGAILLYTYAKRKEETIFLLAWQLPYLIFYCFYFASQWVMWRFIMPSIPALCILASSSLLIVDKEKVQFLLEKLSFLHLSS